MWFFGKKKKSEYPSGREMAEKLNGKHIKYVTERKDDEDFVIGREGALILKGDEFLVFSSADVVFRCHVDQLQASELLSLEGVIIKAPDIEHGGEFRNIIAYYTYYIK
ncbi:MAG: hypothetical protein IJY04_05515 [Clostridia bacterium]|nr:hypothetical protein [Clostridia bacterium]